MKTTRARALLALLVAGVLTAGCGGGGTADPSPGGGNADTPASSSEVAEPEASVTFAGPGGALGDIFKASIEEFTQETGIDVTYVEGRVGDNFARVQAGAQAGQVDIDVLLANDAVDPIGRAQGLFAPLDEALVPNIADLAPIAVREDRIGVLVMFTLVGLLYNQEALDERGLEPPTSWADLWNPDYDCVIIAEPSGGNGLKGFVVMNYVASGGDYFDIDATIEELSAARDNIVGIEGASEEVINSISAGRGCLSVSNQGRALEAISGGAPVEFVLPEEGVSFIENPLQLVEGASSPVAGQMLINWFLDLPTQQALYEESGFTPMNEGVEAVEEGIAAGVTLAEDLADLEVHSPDMAEAPVDEWLQKFQSEIAAR